MISVKLDLPTFEDAADLRRRKAASEVPEGRDASGGASSSNIGLVPPGSSRPMQTVQLNAAKARQNRDVERDIRDAVPDLPDYGLDQYVKSQLERGRTYQLGVPDKESLHTTFQR